MTGDRNVNGLDLCVNLHGHALRIPLGQRVVVGRGADADVRIDEPSVSRHHCRIERTEAGFRITDLGSERGTRVNGVEVSQIAMRPGDVVELAPGVELQLVPAGGEVEPARGNGAHAPAPETVPPDPSLAVVKRRQRSGRPAPRSGRPAAPPPPTPRALPAMAAEPEPKDEAGAPPALPAVERARPRRATPQPGRSPDSSPRSKPAPSGRRSRVVAKKSSTGILIGAALGAVALIVILAIALSGDGGEGEARRILDGARAHRGEGRLQAALHDLDQLLADHPETPAASEARAERETLLRTIESHEQALDALSAVLTDPTPMSRAERENRLESVRARFPRDAVTGAEFKELLAESSAISDKRARAHYDAVKGIVRAHVIGKSFGRALIAIAEAETSPLLTPEIREELNPLREGVLTEVRKAWGELSLALKSLNAAAALDRIRIETLRFAGTPYEGEIRAKETILETAIAAARAGEAEMPESLEAVESRLLPGALKALADAELLAAQRSYAAAAEGFQAAADRFQPQDRKRLLPRIERMRHLAAGVEALTAKIKNEPDVFRGVELESGRKADIVNADRKGLLVAFDEATKVRWNWDVLDPTTFERLVTRAGLKGRSAVDAALFLVEIDAGERALKLLGRAYEKEPRLRPEIETLVAEIQGLPGVPAGGFEYSAGTFKSSGGR